MVKINYEVGAYALIWLTDSNISKQIEDARTKRGSSHIGCKLTKMAKTLCPCVGYTLHTYAVSSSVSYTCFEHLFTYYELTQMVEIGAL